MKTLRDIPQIDKFLSSHEFGGICNALLTKIAQEVIQELRDDLLCKNRESFDEFELICEVKKRYLASFESSLIPIINATGVILHTNMGRSLIAKELFLNVAKVVCNYSNLEYNLEKGCRGERYEHVSEHLKTLLGVEDVLVVNNNASAVFLILNTFAANKEVVVSRGELVEIGGSFRIPEVMRQSGAILKEVGATNKTKKIDYQNAIGENTAMLMKVHQSNFSIEGFSEATPYADIKKLSEEHGLIDYCDWGSGYIPTLPYNLGNKEPSLLTFLQDRPSLLSFSGDKLFGSVQAGIIVGKKELINKLKKNQLLRMLRVDKITLALLEETIKAYLQERYEQIPTLWLLMQDVASLHKRALHVRVQIGKNLCEVVESRTFMGGGTLPNRDFPTVALHVRGKAVVLEKKFRENHLIGRIENDKFLIDFRSILPELEPQIIQIAKGILG
ncbi:MAG: L-seryl-tRNA(Sec) selenium transferase [Sulfurospirillum sp.]|nr:L-seryl-tRNA(Sec) selenium transferase [Sulfurospirillum sp.]